MKLLLDECVVQEFRHLVAGHDVFTVGFMGWSGLKNGELLARAAAEGFEALLTTDQKIQYEQNAATLPLSIVVLVALSNDLNDLRPLVSSLLATLQTLKPKSFVTVRR